MNILRGAILTSAIFISAHTQAALVSGNAVFGDVNIETTGSASFVWTGVDYFIASADVNVASAYYSDDFYSGELPGSAMSLSLMANGETFSSADANRLPASYTEAEGAGDAFAYSFAELGYEVSGVGQVTVTFEAALFANILGSIGSETVEVSTVLTDSFGGVDIFESYFFGDDIEFEDFNTLSLTFNVNGFSQDILGLEANALALTGVNPVPVPAAAWLLMSGLLGLAGIARSKK